MNLKAIEAIPHDKEVKKKFPNSKMRFISKNKIIWENDSLRVASLEKDSNKDLLFKMEGNFDVIY